MKHLKEIRERIGLSQEQFADVLGISRAWLAQLETNEEKEPSNKLKDKIREVVFMHTVVPARRLMSDAKRTSDTINSIDWLKKLPNNYQGKNLHERRVLLIDILDKNKIPAIVPADWAIKIYETSLSKGNWLDVIPLDYYDLDDLERLTT
jgi:transcriptional regulator with XRE-family HTH domain